MSVGGVGKEAFNKNPVEKCVVERPAVRADLSRLSVGVSWHTTRGSFKPCSLYLALRRAPASLLHFNPPASFNLARISYHLIVLPSQPLSDACQPLLLLYSYLLLFFSFLFLLVCIPHPFALNIIFSIYTLLTVLIRYTISFGSLYKIIT